MRPSLIRDDGRCDQDWRDCRGFRARRPGRAVARRRGLPARATPASMSAADSERRRAMAQAAKIDIERVDHIGIRVRDLDRAMDFYGILGFTLLHKADF